MRAVTLRNRKLFAILAVFLAFLWQVRPSQSVHERGTLQLQSLSNTHFKFSGLVGERVEANIQSWLLRAPQSNPGMLEMFQVRDRKPEPQLVPWAGEFVGKYLISGVAALRMTEDPRLFQQVSNVVNAFIAAQAEDGYLGPFPKDTRLLKNWDLWGHFHAIEALLLWYQHTGDSAALTCARKAADLICRTYLDTGRRVFDAGDSEMNMAILTGLARLYRVTAEQRYLRMAREVEKDWERAGDYLRAGLDGREFYQSPRPRWESLHDLQGLLELWRITGEAKYRDAFVHHWRSIRRWDQRNTGGFSSGEQATGNSFAPTAIETCCTVAWIALTVDYLRLTGDSLAADDLELSTLNAGLGAQHPSGSWWTYNTPMDGVREASAHTIVFQARAGTPELNCCSVNGPRVLGMLADWTVMSGHKGVTLNSYLPCTLYFPEGHLVKRLVLDQDYPRCNRQRIVVTPAKAGEEWSLRLRIPGWSKVTRVSANFAGAPGMGSPGSYLDIRRRWRAGDALTLEFDFALRATPGANEAASKVSLYRGPLLLAYDQARNAFDEETIPAVDLARLSEARVLSPPQGTPRNPPWVEIQIPCENGRLLNLIDFAGAGAAGTRYRTWLPAAKPLPSPAFTQKPADGERFHPAPTQFKWRGPAQATYRLEIAPNPVFVPVTFSTNTPSREIVLDVSSLPAVPTSNRWWRVVTVSPEGEAAPDVPPAGFVLAADAPPPVIPQAAERGPHGELLLHSLRKEEGPQHGALVSQKYAARTTAGTQVNGRDQMLVYCIPEWPEENFTLAIRVRIDELPQGRIGQIFSGWARGMDDPLRLVVEKGKLFARIECGGAFDTEGVPVIPGTWYDLAAVKRGSKLILYVDGRPSGSCLAPLFTDTSSHLCALGGNPLFTGSEFLAATFADFRFWDRALAEEEIRRVFGDGQGR
jgi:uncharacterized protein